MKRYTFNPFSEILQYGKGFKSKLLYRPLLKALPGTWETERIPNIVSSSVDIEMKDPKNADSWFVIPSQLNGAEYRSHKNEHIVKKIWEYNNDRTGGPIAQLTGHHAVAEFMLDNAQSNDNPNGMFNTMKDVGAVVVNGYLKVYPHIEFPFSQLSKMKVLGMEDVNVMEKDHSVNIIYASGVPVGKYTNPYESKDLLTVAKAVTTQQYYGALEAAFMKDKNARVFMMPLGIGVFECPIDTVADSIVNSIGMFEENYPGHGLDIRLLVYYSSYKDAELVKKLCA